MAGSGDRLVVPGDVLFPSNELRRPGKGTYELHGSIYASLAGFLFIRQDKHGDRVVDVIEVRRSEGSVVPFIGGVVTARVGNIGQRFAKCALLCIENVPLATGGDFTAMLRRENIHANDKDKTDLPKCISPGDVILARVISFGDNQTSFLLSIAEDELGVISAIGENGERMLPIDWETVQGVLTGLKEKRKVAQVPKLNSALEGFTAAVKKEVKVEAE